MKQILVTIAVILAIAVSAATLWDFFSKKPVYTIEQRLSPELMDRLDAGETIKVEKGISLEGE
ncbi:MAG: hypothetical protein V3U84_10810 [Thiotrichaceae bacterium]